MAREQVKRSKPAVKGPAPVVVEGVLLDIEGKRVTDDPWTLLADDEAPPQGDVIVSVKRLLAECEALVKRNGGRLGVTVAPEDSVEEIAPFLPNLSLVAVQFPTFRDGRGYSTARLLRERYHYQGELRAIGDVLQDQLFFMLRCGFTSFTLKGKDPEAAFARVKATFTYSYQPAADHRKTVLARRLNGEKAT